LEVGTQITDPTELAKLNSSDNERASYSDELYEFHRFKFKIDEPVSKITQIFVLHEGYGTYNGHTLYIWNYTDSKWEEVDTTTVGTPDQTLSKTFTSDFSDYIDEDGYLHLLAMTNEYVEPTTTIYTDYVEVEITLRIDRIESDWEYPAPPTIDGNFTPGEWTDPQLLIEEPIHTFVYFTNDSNFLYGCVDAANEGGGDYSLDDGDYCTLCFDTGHDEVWTPGHEDCFQVYGNGGTEHFIGTSTDYVWEFCCPFAHPGLNGAVGFGGSPNSDYDPTFDHRIYEFQIPLDLLGAAPGDTIGFASPTGPPTLFNSIPHDFATVRHNVWPPGAVYDDLRTWGDLVLELPPPSPGGGVGGEAYPVNKLGILAPWIGLAVLLIGGITWFTLRHRRLRAKY